MRRICVSLFFISLSIGCGSIGYAADMPMKAPVLKTFASAPSWTGFYVGGGFGYGAYTADVQPFSGGNPALRPYSTGGKGWLATAIIGADYQFAGRWVAGVFADIDWTGIKGEYEIANAAFVGTRQLNSAWAAGARLGYLTTPGTLLYATGGYTQARFSGADLRFLGVGGSTGDTIDAATFHGFFVGAGAETQLWGNWFGRLEYRFADYEKVREAVVPTIFQSDFQPTVQTVRVELTYKFGMASPLAAAMPVKAPVSSGPPVNWTGLYAGGGFGYGAWTADQQQLTPAGVPSEQTVSFGGKGWLGTLVLGGDYQFADRWVAGLFADVDWTDIKGEDAVWTGTPSGIGTRTLNWAWAVGARLGYVATPGSMIYGTGGFTQARFSGVGFDDAFTGAPFVTTNADTFNGYFLGAGAETQLWGNWFGHLEYRYADFGKKQEQVYFLTGAPFIPEDFHPTVQTVRLALTYKFH